MQAPYLFYYWSLRLSDTFELSNTLVYLGPDSQLVNISIALSVKHLPFVIKKVKF